MQERLQKILARAGHGARRKCEAMISDGRVSVNGEVVTELGTKADPEKDEICLDGNPVVLEQPVYIMLNKPAGCVSSTTDTRDRTTVMEYLKDAPGSVFHVGRLDYLTQGLLLFTNDGDFAQKVMHPSHKIWKTYEAVVQGMPQGHAIKALRYGVILRDGPTAPARVKIVGQRTESIYSKKKPNRPPRTVEATVVQIVIHEGRKRQVRRMFKVVGHPVLKLKRLKVGGLELGDLAERSWRQLTPEEAALALEAPKGDG
ncbi:pseudouridine synthase [bacterium]